MRWPTPRSGRSGSRSPTRRWTTCATGWPAPAGRTSCPASAGAAACRSATCKELAGYWRDGYDWRAAGGPAQPVPAVHHRDRRADHPLPARPLARARRPAADPHPRLARLDRGVPGRRSARSPTRAPTAATRPTRSTWSPLPARLRLLDAGPRAGMGDDPDRQGLGGADGPPRLRALRRPGRRHRRGRHRDAGPASTPTTWSASTSTATLWPLPPSPCDPARGRPGSPRPSIGPAWSGCASPQADGARLPPAADDPAPDAGLRPDRLAGRPAGLDRREVQGVDRPAGRPARGRRRPRPAADQRQPLLVHRHRRIGRPVPLRGRPRRRLAGPPRTSPRAGPCSPPATTWSGA